MADPEPGMLVDGVRVDITGEWDACLLHMSPCALVDTWVACLSQLDGIDARGGEVILSPAEMAIARLIRDGDVTLTPAKTARDMADLRRRASDAVLFWDMAEGTLSDGVSRALGMCADVVTTAFRCRDAGDFAARLAELHFPPHEPEVPGTRAELRGLLLTLARWSKAGHPDPRNYLDKQLAKRCWKLVAAHALLDDGRRTAVRLSSAAARLEQTPAAPTPVGSSDL